MLTCVDITIFIYIEIINWRSLDAVEFCQSMIFAKREDIDVAAYCGGDVDEPVVAAGEAIGKVEANGVGDVAVVAVAINYVSSS